MNLFVGCRRMIPAGLMLSLAHAPSLGAQAADGKVTFEEKCVACHSLGSDRLVGPGLADITERRDRAWVLRFITSPDEMIADGDPIATELLAEYQVPMPNLGITAEEADAIVVYLEAAESPTGEGAAPEASPVPEGDPDAGLALFTGADPLDNGGASCISCHSVGGLAGVGGGTLAADLSKVSTRYGDALRGVLGTLPFPVMQDIFAERSLTEQEMSDLAAFFRRVDEEAPAGEPFLAFPSAGLGGAFLVLLMFGFLGRRRLMGVRKPLIGGHR